MKPARSHSRRQARRADPVVRVIHAERDDPAALEDLFRLFDELLDRELRRVG